MAIDLTKPLAWKAASVEEQKMLQCLQGNILKGHGRTETVNIFFEMDSTKALQMKIFPTRVLARTRSSDRARGHPSRRLGP